MFSLSRTFQLLFCSVQLLHQFLAVFVKFLSTKSFQVVSKRVEICNALAGGIRSRTTIPFDCNLLCMVDHYPALILK